MGTQPWVVMKFGGTSVASASGWKTIAGLCLQRREQGFRVLLVHSAVAGITDHIEQLALSAVKKRVDEKLPGYCQPHRELANALGIDAEAVIQRHAESLAGVLNGIHLLGEAAPKLRARALAHGEWLATRLGELYLNTTSTASKVVWQDARDLIRLPETARPSHRGDWLSANPDHKADHALQKTLARHDWVITQGFVAADGSGQTVVLGRGGSDTSATLLAGRLGAARAEIWTDVPGMFSANPRMIPQARLLKALTFEEAQEIAATGAKVLHPRSVRPVRENNIPLWIRSTLAPELDGTQITRSGSQQGRVKAISVRHAITLISMETVRMWQQPGFLAEAFDIFRRHGISIDLITTAESAVTVSLDTAAGLIEEPQIEALSADLMTICRVKVIRECAAISLVGRQIRSVLHQLAPAFELFGNESIHMLGQAANDLNLTVVVDEAAAARLTRALHEQLISRQHDPELYGPTWEQMNQHDADRTAARPARWWQKNAQALTQLASQHGPCYVYSLEPLQRRLDALTAMRSIDRVLYAVKANAHPILLRTVASAGLGFETVSPGEVDHVLEQVPGLAADQLLFTPNFAPASDYRYGLEKGVQLTIDNLYILEQWAEQLQGASVFLRVDLANARGHHSHVRTAGKGSKFGIPVQDLPRARALAQAAGIQIIGLHTHAGSGVLDPAHWYDTALSMAQLAGEFDQVRILDLGGGLGVPERPETQPLDLTELDAKLLQVKERYPGYQFWLEPGRFLVAEAGVLLARVTQLKGKQERQYIGVEAGMNSLIRPALYGAWHDIVNLSRLDQPREQLVSVVGPICETGDRLGSERLFPSSEEGDVILIDTTGAYGAVMASNYNRRQPAVELVVDREGRIVER